jgi:hypothetical protein
VFALILTVGVALHQLLDPSQHKFIPAYAGARAKLASRGAGRAQFVDADHKLPCSRLPPANFIVPVSYSPNTYSMDAVEVFLSSGAFCKTKTGCREPTRTAMYCLPLTE